MFAALLLWSAPARAAVTAQTPVAAARAEHPLPLDPSLADPLWQQGAIPVPGSFENLTTRAGAPLATQVWMLYDSRNLYVAMRAEQRGLPITAGQATNDVGFGLDDFMGVGIDTSGVGSQAYLFEVTPRGVRYEQASENARYRPRWQAAASVKGSAWTAVFIIPLRTMRIHAGNPQTWRINFIRAIAANAEHYTWSYDGLMQDAPVGSGWPAFTDVRYWAQWTGIQVDRSLLSAAKPSPRAEIYGLESAGADRDVFQQANGAFERQHVRVTGLDVTYPVTPTINFVGTLNPDFSNVEIDQQTIAPQEFRRQLQEYRPFFTQGASFINADAIQIGPNLLFYSPSVGPFDRGEKIEGTFGKQSFGVLNFRGFDQTTGNTFDDTAYGYKHALQNRTFLYWVDGVSAHHSLFGSDESNEGGVAVRNLRTGFVGGFDYGTETGSWVPGGHAQTFTGFLDVHKPNYEVNVGENQITPNFNPIDGFTATSDVQGPNMFLDTSGATRALKNFIIFASADRYLDRSGAVHQADSSLSLNATFQNGFSIDGLGPNVSELRNYSVIDPAAFGTTCDDPSLPRSSFTGFPAYRCGRTDTYNLFFIPIGYHDGTPSPIDVSEGFGRFGYGMVGSNDNGPDYLHLYTLSFSRPIARVLSLGFEWDGTYERALHSGATDAQFLRRLSLGAQLGPDSNLTLSLRGISGRGGFALPGTNVAAAFHRRFRSGDELFVNFGTPAASSTLNRFIVKYLFRFGGDSGT
ncbi:MAG TPA: DUF5916 domain-containing protein [Candidatus Baltobacteraceae bacterium]|nr:DUF5916 domain-containing protein [Candidatus Baltobacteraceae bacterium]